MFVPQHAADWRMVTLHSAKKQRPLLDRDLIKSSIRLAHLPLISASDAKSGTKMNRRGCWLSILWPVLYHVPACLVAPGCSSSVLACQSPGLKEACSSEEHFAMKLLERFFSSLPSICYREESNDLFFFPSNKKECRQAQKCNSAICTSDLCSGPCFYLSY